MSRLRVKFCRGEELKFISHLDIMRLWQRAFSRAQVPLAYSEGFNPRPRISLAVPLAIGVTSDVELMDVFLTYEMSPHGFQQAVNRVLPAGIKILQAFSISLTEPSLTALISCVDYRVEVETDLTTAQVDSALQQMLARENLPWQHQRDTGTRNYDLRVLIDDLFLEECRHHVCTINMRLRSDANGSGRPEQVAAALGFAYPRSIHRTRLIMKN